MTNALGPCSSAEYHVVRTSKRVGLGIGETGPCARETGRGPRVEVSLTVATDGFDDEKIFATANIVHV